MSTIAKNTSGCFEAFDLALRSLSAADSNLSSKISYSALEDQLGRLRVWAGNLGCFAGGHASLDFRLRDVSSVRENIVKILEDLRDCLRESKFFYSPGTGIAANNPL